MAVRLELLPYADHPVALHERVLLLAYLDEHGSISVAGCRHVLRSNSNPVGVTAALVLKSVIVADLGTGLLEPRTRIRRAEPFCTSEREGQQ